MVPFSLAYQIPLIVHSPLGLVGEAEEFVRFHIAHVSSSLCFGLDILTCRNGGYEIETHSSHYGVLSHPHCSSVLLTFHLKFYLPCSPLLLWCLQSSPLNHFVTLDIFFYLALILIINIEHLPYTKKLPKEFTWITSQNILWVRLYYCLCLTDQNKTKQKTQNDKTTCPKSHT